MELSAAKTRVKASLALRSVKAALGLVLYTFGNYLFIQANIGVAPWDCLNLGIASQLGLTYGQASIGVSVLVLIVDLLLSERIGIGTILDAILCGVCMDLFMGMSLVPAQTDSVAAIAALTVGGMFIMAVGQVVYMSAGLSCGPRDSLLVGVGRRLKKLPIGLVAVMMQSAVVALGWALGGKVGIGTIIAAFGMGVTMQLVFHLFKFEPRNVRHEDVIESCRALFSKSDKKKSADSKGADSHV